MGTSSWSLCNKLIMRWLLECKFSFTVSLWQTLRALLCSLKAVRPVLSVHITGEKRKENNDTKKNPFTHKKKNNNEFISFSSMQIIKLAKRKEETNQANQIFTVRDFLFYAQTSSYPDWTVKQPRRELPKILKRHRSSWDAEKNCLGSKNGIKYHLNTDTMLSSKTNR